MTVTSTMISSEPRLWFIPRVVDRGTVTPSTGLGGQRVHTQEAVTLTSAVHADAAVAGSVVAERYRDTVYQLHAKFGDSFMVEHVSHALTATPAGVTPAGYIATVLIAYSFHFPPESPQQQTAAVGEDKPAIVEKLLGGLTARPLDPGTQPAR